GSQWLSSIRQNRHRSKWNSLNSFSPRKSNFFLNKFENFLFAVAKNICFFSFTIKYLKKSKNDKALKSSMNVTGSSNIRIFGPFCNFRFKLMKIERTNAAL